MLKHTSYAQGVIPAAASQRTSRGITLIETIVVTLFVGVLVAFGSATLFNQRDPLRQATNELEGTFKQTRAKAMAATTACRVRPSSSTAVITECASSCTAAAGSWDEKEGLTLTLDDDVELTSTGWSICFNSRGISDTSGSVNLTYTDGDITTTSQISVFLGGAITNSLKENI